MDHDTNPGVLPSGPDCWHFSASGGWIAVRTPGLSGEPGSHLFGGCQIRGKARAERAAERARSYPRGAHAPLGCANGGTPAIAVFRRSRGVPLGVHPPRQRKGRSNSFCVGPQLPGGQKVKMSRIKYSPYRGFTLIELMAAIPVMAVFLLMAGQLFVSCLHTFRAADLRAQHLSQRRGLIRELRQDVATAAQLQLQGAHGLICHYGKKRLVLWMVNANGTVARMWQDGKNSPRPQYWPALLPALHFHITAHGDVELNWLVGHRRVRETLTSPMTQSAEMGSGQ